MLDRKTEWERARQILEKADDAIVDLRKVGFSFHHRLSLCQRLSGWRKRLLEP